jgi:hypothetical protein
MAGVDQAYVSRLERGMLAGQGAPLRIETCIKLAAAIGCVYRGSLRRGRRRVRGLSELDITGLGDLTLDACGKFAIAVGCFYVSELQPISK